MQIEFYKYHGTGNDFVLLDNRDGRYSSLTTAQVRNICRRHFGVGADGLMMWQHKSGYDFEMLYFNADGKPGTMCGNGGRCMVKFVHDLGYAKNQYKFWAPDGEHVAEIDGKIIRLKMQDVSGYQQHGHEFILDTGSPHYVKMVTDVAHLPVPEEGKKIRYSDQYKEKGINVNFAEVLDDDSIFVRTYERGVEDETLSCGTGVTAAALLNAHNGSGFNHVDVKTRGGDLYVEFDKAGERFYTNIWLCGQASFVFSGSGNWE